MRLSFIISFVFLLLACGPSKKDTASGILPPKEFSEMLKSDPEIVLLDVRSNEEMQGGYIEGAKHLDFNGEGFSNSLDSLDRSKMYLVYCASGKRSGKAYEMMKEKGFQNVSAMDGGLRMWNANGLPTVKP